MMNAKSIHTSASALRKASRQNARIADSSLHEETAVQELDVIKHDHRRSAAPPLSSSADRQTAISSSASVRFPSGVEPYPAPFDTVRTQQQHRARGIHGMDASDVLASQSNPNPSRRAFVFMSFYAKESDKRPSLRCTFQPQPGPSRRASRRWCGSMRSCTARHGLGLRGALGRLGDDLTRPTSASSVERRGYPSDISSVTVTSGVC
ncbi:hypothetical protein C8R45DRAFT_548722 [Mycena sanguinolenta]|nr:hypothetical protein C8R45DRAFT_548722 [Mycena sanguinolenta]